MTTWNVNNKSHDIVLYLSIPLFWFYSFFKLYNNFSWHLIFNLQIHRHGGRNEHFYIILLRKLKKQFTTNEKNIYLFSCCCLLIKTAIFFFFCGHRGKNSKNNKMVTHGGDKVSKHVTLMYLHLKDIENHSKPGFCKHNNMHKITCPFVLFESS